MRKLTFTAILFVFIINVTNAQKVEHNYFFEWDYQKAIYEPIQYFPTKNVKEIRFTQSKGGKTKSYVKRYNDQGDLLSYGSLSNTGEETPIYFFERNEYGQAILSKAYRNGKLKYTMKQTYEAEGGGRTSVEKINASGKLKLRNTWKYKATDCLSQSTRYKGNGKVKSKWVYSYYDECDKKKTDLYNGKDKLIKTWSYACKQEGELVEKKKDTVQNCKWEESDGKYLLSIYQSLDEKGKIRKYVTKYTLEDTLIVENSTYDGENQLVSRSTYDHSYRKPLDYVYYRKGEIRSQTKYSYQGDQLSSHEFYYKNKLRTKSTYVYKDSLLVQYNNIGRNGKETLTLLEYPAD